MSRVAKVKNKLVRGTSKTVFRQNKYVCVGSKPRRNVRGVEAGHYNLDGVLKEE